MSIKTLYSKKKYPIKRPFYSEKHELLKAYKDPKLVNL